MARSRLGCRVSEPIPTLIRYPGGERASHGGIHGNLAVVYLVLELARHRAPFSAHMLILAGRSVEAHC
jgi:hypothetical protein